MTGLGAFAISEGDYKVVLHPMDVDGNVCGIKYGEKLDMTDYPNFYYINSYSTGVCVKTCPTVAGGIDPLTFVGVGGVTGTNAADYSAVAVNTAAYTDYSDNPTDFPTGYSFPVLDTVSYMNRCTLTTVATNALEAQITLAGGEQMSEDEDGTLTKIYGDLYDSMNYILGFGFVIAMVVSFVYSFLLRIPGVLFLMIWGCIGTVFAMVAGIGAYAFTEAENWRTTEPGLSEHCSGATLTANDDGTVTASDCTEADALMYVSYAFFGIAAIWFLLICYLRSRIQLALAIVKEAAKSIAAMPLIILFPVMQCVGFVIFMVIWMIYAVYLASLGEPQETGICSDVTLITESLCTGGSGIWIKYQDFVYNEDQTKMGWYLLFTYFWSSQFIIAVGQIVVAMCVAKWYFCRDKSSISSGTVFQSIKDSLYYHTGTAAFGSLIIAIIKMIRAAIAYAQKKAKQSGSKVAQAVLCALQCYMWCMEKCMKFLNKNAYIQTAIFGTHFCASAKNAFFLILRNIARIGACTIVSEFVIIIGKMFICSVTGGCAYFLMDSAEELDLHYIYAPVTMVMILSWFVASMFMNIFGMAISTILQCFVADEEMFDSGTRFATSELASFIDSNGAPDEPKKGDDNTL
jgi:choline transporter-like protein 2/4/5